MQNSDLMPESPISRRHAESRAHSACMTRWSSHLRNFIVEGVLAPGMKLNEREFAKRSAFRARLCARR